MIGVNIKVSFRNHGLRRESLCLVEECWIECMFQPSIAAAWHFLTAGQADRVPCRQGNAWETKQQGQQTFQRYQARSLLESPHTLGFLSQKPSFLPVFDTPVPYIIMPRRTAWASQVELAELYDMIYAPHADDQSRHKALSRVSSSSLCVCP